MTSTLEKRFEHFGASAENTDLLVAAGYSTPKLIKAAERADIVDLIGESDTATLLARLGQE